MARDPHQLRMEPLTMFTLGGEETEARVRELLAEVADILAEDGLVDNASAKLRIDATFTMSKHGAVEVSTTCEIVARPKTKGVTQFALLRGGRIVVEPDQGVQLDLPSGADVVVR
jgi:hypothetical protein